MVALDDRTIAFYDPNLETAAGERLVPLRHYEEPKLLAIARRDAMRMAQCIRMLFAENRKAK